MSDKDINHFDASLYSSLEELVGELPQHIEYVTVTSSHIRRAVKEIRDLRKAIAKLVMEEK